MQDPMERLVGVVRWYLSGFYIKPQVTPNYNMTLHMLLIPLTRSAWNSPKPSTTSQCILVLTWFIEQGVKKPYNPLLGEFFRCKWVHDDGSTTHYVAEQVSHHPPVSCMYFSNRKEGFVINGSMHPRSKFLGTSAASIMEGTAYLTILAHDEEYTITFPSVYGRGMLLLAFLGSFPLGILFGTLLMELVGVVHIQCAKTGCKAEIDFKAKVCYSMASSTS